jgi:hypothetical protein
MAAHLPHRSRGEEAAGEEKHNRRMKKKRKKNKKRVEAQQRVNALNEMVTGRQPNSSSRKNGSQLLNWLIDLLPFEVHLPGYRFCGPGTRLQTRLKSGQRGVNKLDELCRGHDIAYSMSSEASDRAIADERLRVGAKMLTRDASVALSERLAARLVATVMKIKLAV